MGYTAVRSHTRRGYPVRAHGRRTAGRHITEVLANDRDRVYGGIALESRPTPVSPSTKHPRAYRVTARRTIGCIGAIRGAWIRSRARC